MKAVLLAAGKGSRLRPLTNTISKQMISIAGKPLVEYIINELSGLGFNEICIVIGHNGNQIKKYFGNGDKFKIKIKYELKESIKEPLMLLNTPRIL